MDLQKRLENLSPQRRALLDKLLRQRGAAPAIHADQVVISGPVPLTPAQHLSFETHDPDRHLFNIGTVFETRLPLDRALVEQATRAVLAHHDALRLRSVQHNDGWRQHIAPLEETLPCTWVDLSALPDGEQRAAVTSTGGALRAAIDVTHGPLLQVALFERGPQRPRYLLIIVHHIVCDHFSFDILIQDFQTACEQLCGGRPLALPAKTTSLQYWAGRLADYAGSSALLSERGFWAAALGRPAATLPKDRPDGLHTGDSSVSLLQTLSAPETAALQQLPRACGVPLEAVLLAALVRAAAHWTGSPAVAVDLLRSGREQPFAEVDLARTMGWFNYQAPLRFELAPDAPALDQARAVQAQMQAVPGHGIGYGVLRYLCPDQQVRAEMRALPQPEIFFNYRGAFGARPPSPFERVQIPIGQEHSSRVVIPYALLLNLEIFAGQLWIEFKYSANIHTEATAARLLGGYIDELRLLAQGGPADS